MLDDGLKKFREFITVKYNWKQMLKDKEGIEIGKEIKLSLFADDMILSENS